MSDHLPDCNDYAFSGAGYHPDCERICICRQVRRIEQRVREEERALIAVEQTTLAELNAEYRKGLDAAREAVERVSTLFEPLGPALAAIDALRATNP